MCSSPTSSKLGRAETAVVATAATMEAVTTTVTGLDGMAYSQTFKASVPSFFLSDIESGEL